MSRNRAINRRSFIGRVLGSAIVAGGAVAAVSGPAAGQSRRLIVDADPSDVAHPQITDADSGTMSDPPSRGRGGPESRQIHVVDVDDGSTADPRGHGRGPVGPTRAASQAPSRPAPRPRPEMISDSDAGPGGDPVARGRGPTQRFVICPEHPRCPRNPRDRR